MERGRLGARLVALVGAFNKARLRPEDAARLLQGPFSYSTDEAEFAGYSWHEITSSEWGVYDAQDRLVARLLAPAEGRPHWSYRWEAQI